MMSAQQPDPRRRDTEPRLAPPVNGTCGCGNPAAPQSRLCILCVECSVAGRLPADLPALALGDLKTAAEALELAARALEGRYGKNSPQAEAVLQIFDRVHDLLPRY
jgi:hypothetical protein